MNSNPKAIRILCYGDSNTWGYIPGTGERFDPSLRWTGLLQKSLGERFEIIEEGLNSRTTVLDDPKHEGKNGEKYLKPCLQTHYPLDGVILMLGTNDLKERFDRTAEQITQGIETLISIIQNAEYHYDKDPKVILLVPPYIDESIEGDSGNFKGAGEKSKQLGNLYKKVAEEYATEFINVAQFVSPSKIDGYHFDQESQKKIAELLAVKVLDLWH